MGRPPGTSLLPQTSNVFGQFPRFAVPSSFGQRTRKTPSRVYELAEFLQEEMSAPSRRVFDRLYSVEYHSGKLKVPPAFEDRVRKMFAAYPGGTKHLGFVEDQKVLVTENKYTFDHSMFNEVRRYRPGYNEKPNAEDEAKYEAAINETRGSKCDFCNGRTAVDVFGKISGNHCYIASNVAKYEGWHAVVVSNEHHPLKFTAEMIEDYISASYQWFQAVRNADGEMQYPHLMWDSGPRASASQMHQHLQLIMTRRRYLTRAEHVRLAAMRYELKYPGSNFWGDMAAAHDVVGLAARLGSCVIISHISPIKEREVIVVCASGSDPAFARLIHIGLRSLIDDVGMRAFSAGISFEPFDAPNTQMHYPAVARIVDRGNPLDLRSDVGAMEFYGAYNVGADPYHVMPFIRARLEKLQQ